MFTRAEMTSLSGLRHQTTYRLEERNTLVPQNGKYEYNQVIFGRVLEQVRRTSGVTAIKFADNFGSQAQHEINWLEAQLLFVTNQGVGIIPDDLSAATDEWLLPIEQEAFIIRSEYYPGLKAFFLEHFRFALRDETDMIIVAVYRIRKAIEKIAEQRNILHKIKKTTHRDQVLVS